MVSEDVITSLKVDVLKSLAKKAGLPRSLTRKADLVKALGDYLCGNLKDFLDRLTDREQAFLTEAVHNQGWVAPQVFQAKYNVQCPMPGRWLDPKRASLLHLVITGDDDHDGVCIPKTLAEALRPLVPKPPAVNVNVVDGIPAVFPPDPDDHLDQRPVHVFHGEQSAFAELGRVLNLVQAGKVRIQSKSRRPTSGTEGLLSGALAVPDFDVDPPLELRDTYTELAGPIRAHAWAVLVQQCGWCKPHGGKLMLTRAGKEMASNQCPSAFRDGMERLISDDRFDEFHRVNRIRGQTGKGKRGMTAHQRGGRQSAIPWPSGR